MKRRIIIGAAVALAAVFLMPGATSAQEPACREGTHAIYTAGGTLVSCEEIIGSPTSCPADAAPGYLESGQLAGCFTGAVGVEGMCQPLGVDSDGDGLDDGCDPCPNNPDCDGDNWGDGAELYMGTDPQDACPDNPSDDAWPPDFNNSGAVTVADLVAFRQHAQWLGLPYNARYDLNASGAITSADLIIFSHYYTGTGHDTCTDGAGVGALGSPWCWECVNFPVKTATYHEWGEFRWTIPMPWPIPDRFRVEYRMDLTATFVWLELGGVYYAAFGQPNYTSAWPEWPYYIFDEPWIQYDQESPDKLKVTAGTAVWLFPEWATAGYPIRLWMEFLAPNQVTYWGTGFHYYWAEEGR